METYERRTQIWEKLRIRRKDTIANLAIEFGVSKQTIRRDIDALSREHNIYTMPGRYNGGIFVGDNTEYIKHFNEKELSVMKKISEYIKNNVICILTSEEISIFDKIIFEHTKPPLNNKRYVHKKK